MVKQRCALRTRCPRRSPAVYGALATIGHAALDEEGAELSGNAAHGRSGMIPGPSARAWTIAWIVGSALFFLFFVIAIPLWIVDRRLVSFAAHPLVPSALLLLLAIGIVGVSLGGPIRDAAVRRELARGYTTVPYLWLNADLRRPDTGAVVRPASEPPSSFGFTLRYPEVAAEAAGSDSAPVAAHGGTHGGSHGGGETGTAPADSSRDPSGSAATALWVVAVLAYVALTIARIVIEVRSDGAVATATYAGIAAGIVVAVAVPLYVGYRRGRLRNERIGALRPGAILAPSMRSLELSATAGALARRGGIPIYPAWSFDANGADLWDDRARFPLLHLDPQQIVSVDVGTRTLGSRSWPSLELGVADPRGFTRPLPILVRPPDRPWRFRSAAEVAELAARLTAMWGVPRG
jgi:hypothetical protein